MSGRAWLRNPPRTLGQRPPCPTGLDRITTLDHARAALMAGLGAPGLEAWACSECGGAHITDPNHPARSQP